MLNYTERNPLPPVCEGCEEEDCYNCDYALDRMELSPIDELRLMKKLKERAIERLQRQIAEIDKKLAEFDSGES